MEMENNDRYHKHPNPKQYEKLVFLHWPGRKSNQRPQRTPLNRRANDSFMEVIIRYIINSIWV